MISNKIVKTDMMRQEKDASSNDNQLQSINIISYRTTIKGDITTSSDFRIDGELIGNIILEGKFVVGKNGKITGDIRCKNIEIGGFVKGNIEAIELLSMKATAEIHGDIIVGKLSVEPGAMFIGTCTMGVANPENEKPKE